MELTETDLSGVWIIDLERREDERDFFARTWCRLELLSDYQMSQIYAPEFARGVRWDDPALAISWPIKDDVIISKRDCSYPDFAA